MPPPPELPNDVWNHIHTIVRHKSTTIRNVACIHDRCLVGEHPLCTLRMMRLLYPEVPSRVRTPGPDFVTPCHQWRTMDSRS